MITVTIPAAELFDESKEEYIYTKETAITLEHSLVSVSKWESKWEKPFLSGEKLSGDKLISYIQCMTTTQNVDPNVYKVIPASILKEIEDYISSKQTATWFRDDKRSASRRTVTSELIYFWMINYGIPFECQKWHLNRLVTLIRVCQEETKANSKNGNSNQAAALKERQALNELRKSKYHTKG